MKRMFGFLIGVVVGGLVGSTIALLLAPESGEELRSEIRARGDAFFNDVRHEFHNRRIPIRPTSLGANSRMGQPIRRKMTEFPVGHCNMR